MDVFFKVTGYYMVQKPGRTKKVIMVGKVSGKYDILIVEERNVPYRKQEKISRLNYS